LKSARRLAKLNKFGYVLVGIVVWVVTTFSKESIAFIFKVDFCPKHGVTTQKITTGIFTTVRTSNLIIFLII
jgi:hypothetical protein